MLCWRLTLRPSLHSSHAVDNDVRACTTSSVPRLFFWNQTTMRLGAWHDYEMIAGRARAAGAGRGRMHTHARVCTCEL